MDSVNVIFNHTNTYIKDVICTKEIYKNLTEGKEVLVISFDSKKTFAIACAN